MSPILTVRDELEAAVRAASVHMTKADTERRELTAEERADIDKHLSKARELKAVLDQSRDRESLQSELASLIESGRTVGQAAIVSTPKHLKSYGQQFVDSPAFDFFKAGTHRTGSAWTSPSVELVAATLTEDPTSGGALVYPKTLRAGVVPTLFQRTTVADLLAQGTTDSNAVIYMIEKTAVNAAAAVAEGAPKPESTLTFEQKTEPVAKVATWLPVSEEMLADASQIRSYIDARLRLFVEIAMENQILNGDGIAPNMLGLRNRVGLATDVVRGASESNADAMFRQIGAIMANAFVTPDGLVMNPADWAGAVLSKSAQGGYYGNGPFGPMQTPILWGLPVAVTSAMPQGVGLAGAFRLAAQVWYRGGIVVAASNSHADYFIRNLVAIRAEQRAALAVYRPAAIGEVTGLTSGLTTPV
jgi:HK97 family phage major capsid protein